MDFQDLAANEASSLVARLVARRAERSLRELQSAYEAIEGHPLDRRNFRKRMLSTGVIEPTGDLRREGAHRPALLYRFTSREPVFL